MRPQLRRHPLTDAEMAEAWTDYLRARAAQIRARIDAGTVSEWDGRREWKEAVASWAICTRLGAERTEERR